MSDDRGEPLPLEALLSGPAEPDGDARAVLVFEAGGGAYGLDAAGVEAVVPRPPVAPLPYAPPGVVGVASVRGRMRVVVDLGSGVEGARRLVALHGDAHLAVLAGSVSGVVTVAPGQLEEVAGGDGPVVGRFRHDGRRVDVLDPERLVALD